MATSVDSVCAQVACTRTGLNTVVAKDLITGAAVAFRENVIAGADEGAFGEKLEKPPLL